MQKKNSDFSEFSYISITVLLYLPANWDFQT